MKQHRGIDGKEASMDKRVIRQRLRMLRTAMREMGLDYYLVPTADFHNSEYVSEYFKIR